MHLSRAGTGFEAIPPSTCHAVADAHRRRRYQSAWASACLPPPPPSHPRRCVPFCGCARVGVASSPLTGMKVCCCSGGVMAVFCLALVCAAETVFVPLVWAGGWCAWYIRWVGCRPHTLRLLRAMRRVRSVIGSDKYLFRRPVPACVWVWVRAGPGGSGLGRARAPGGGCLCCRRAAFFLRRSSTWPTPRRVRKRS